jgi:hypothetical protein
VPTKFGHLEGENGDNANFGVSRLVVIPQGQALIEL